MKNSHPIISPAAAILAGGLLFTGPAAAAVIFSESWGEIGTDTNAFGMPTYAYAQNYTAPNGQTPAGGARYGHGGPGINGQVSSNVFTANNIVLTTAGLTTAQIDANLGIFNLAAQFSTYTAQNDYAVIAIQFRDQADAPLGAPFTIGGEAFVAALGAGPGGFRQWGTDTEAGSIPSGARTVDITLTETKSAGGLNIDGYVDNLVIDVSAVPEPGTAALSGLAGIALLRRRRR